MPPATSAEPAAPASSCRRVRRTLLPARPDDDEVGEHAIEGLAHFAVTERRRDMLADGVERTAVPPGVQDVPLIGVLVHVEDGRGQAAGADSAPGIAEARDQVALLRVRVDALGYTT